MPSFIAIESAGAGFWHPRQSQFRQRLVLRIPRILCLVAFLVQMHSKFFFQRSRGACRERLPARLRRSMEQAILDSLWAARDAIRGVSGHQGLNIDADTGVGFGNCSERHWYWRDVNRKLDRMGSSFLMTSRPEVDNMTNVGSESPSATFALASAFLSKGSSERSWRRSTSRIASRSRAVAGNWEHKLEPFSRARPRKWAGQAVTCLDSWKRSCLNLALSCKAMGTLLSTCFAKIGQR